jgi:hypothetical protein
MMKIMTALALLLLCGSAHAQDLSRPCDKSAFFNHSVPTGPVNLVLGVEGQRVYLCGFTIMQKGNTLDFILSVGQGVNCADNNVQITPQFELPADFALTTRINAGQPLPGVGYGLCVQTLGSNGKLAGIVYYSQF